MPAQRDLIHTTEGDEMGFQRKPYRLVWPQESRWSGLEVVLRGMTIAELEEIAALKEKVEDSSNLKQILPLLDVLERALLEWNLEDEQGAPISVSALREQDMAMEVYAEDVGLLRLLEIERLGGRDINGERSDHYDQG
jgi:hypothetical protein